VIQRRKLVMNLPFWLARTMGGGLDLASTLTLGLFRNGMITLDQVKSLGVDNMVPAGARGFAELGIQPAAMDAILPGYLWRHRPSGQYAAIKDSAKNLNRR